MKSIKISQGNYAFVDDCDYEIVSKFKWRSLVCKTNIYASGRITRGVGAKSVLMHRFILGLSSKDKIEVDHINGNGLDNRRSNLRPCTRGENSRNLKKRSDNTSGYKGVCWTNDRKKWIAQIQFNGKHWRIGRFNNKIDAALAYDRVAKEKFGEFAKLNFSGG